MTTPFPQPEPQQPPPSPPTVRKLIIEVTDARDLLPKDGLGSSSAYVVVDFDGQKKRTSTVSRNLNPVWNESLEFIVSDPKTMEFEEIEIEVFNDKKLSHGNARKNHFLGRVKLYGSQFAKRGDEGLIYFQLEKKSVFSWIRGEIGLRIYYYDEIVQEQIQESGQNNTNPNNEPPPGAAPPPDQKPQLMVADVLEVQMPPIHMEGSQSPPLVTIQESPPTVTVQMEHHHYHQQQQQQPNYH